MRSRILPCILALGALISASSVARSEVLHGTVTLLPWYMQGCDCGWDQAFDFSEQAITSVGSSGANLAFEFGAQDGRPMWSARNASLLYYLPVTIESLDTVPETGTDGRDIRPTGTFVMKTTEPMWVKFTVRGSTGTDVIIEYYVQTDGTPYFGPALAVESSTWGRVKALYR